MMDEDRLQRMREEYAELFERANRLRQFIDEAEPGSIRGFDLLLAQLNAMQAYANILRARIRFEEAAREH